MQVLGIMYLNHWVILKLVTGSIHTKMCKKIEYINAAENSAETDHTAFSKTGLHAKKKGSLKEIA